MSRVPSRLPRRTLAALLFLGVVGVAAYIVVAPLAALLDPDDSERDLLIQRWSALHAVTLSRPALEAGLKELRASESTIAGLLKGNTSALAAAALQTDVKGIVERNGGEIRSARTLPPSARDSFEKVGVLYELALPMSALEQLLYQIETHSPYLFIDTLDIRMPENWRPGASSTPEPKLALRWQVSGYRRVDGR